MALDPVGLALQNAIALRRYENGIIREVNDLLDALVGKLRDAVVALDPTAVSPGWLDARVQRLARMADEQTAKTYAWIKRLVEDRIVGAAEVQAEVAMRLLERSVSGVDVGLATTTLTPRYLRSLVRTDPIQGAVMREWWSKQAKQTAFAFRRELKIGLGESETLGQLVQRIRGRYVRPGVYEGGILQASTREASALIRTATNQISTQAAFETYAANDDITEQYRYVATLDMRTTELCMSLDGRLFRYDDPTAPRPPMHWNCRSGIAPVVAWEKLGIDQPPPGQRASMQGPVSAELTYERWLRQQPKSLQQQILGKGRAELFRDGKVSLRDLVRSDGTTYTLEQLRAKVNG